MLVGEFAGARSVARQDSPIVGADAVVRPGATTWPLRADFEYALLVLDGEISVGRHVVRPHALAALGTGRAEVSVTARDTARVLLLGGAPFAEPLIMWWNFVARTHDEIDAAVKAWQEGEARFGRVRLRSSPHPRPAADLGATRLRRPARRQPSPPSGTRGVDHDGNGWVECARGHRHWGRHGAAGLLLHAVDDAGAARMLLQHRAEWSHHGGTWGLPGGARDSHEDAVAAALREATEETALDRSRVRTRHTFVDDHGGWSYTTVYADTPSPLATELDQESIELDWWRCRTSRPASCTPVSPRPGRPCRRGRSPCWWTPPTSWAPHRWLVERPRRRHVPAARLAGHASRAHPHRPRGRHAGRRPRRRRGRRAGALGG